METDYESKVKALLAKAESTEFPAEAEALTAKAMALIAEHNIEITDDDPGKMVDSYVVVPGPYRNQRVRLWHAVARVNGVFSLQNGGQRYMRGIGYGTEEAIYMTEALFHSLMIQGDRALLAHKTTVDDLSEEDRLEYMYYHQQIASLDASNAAFAERQGLNPATQTNHAREECKAILRNATKAYRRGFWTGFASETEQRLKSKVNDAYGADPDGSLVPAVVDKTDLAMEFAATRTRWSNGGGSSSSGSAAGRAGGQAAARRADHGGRGVSGGRKAIG